MTASEEQMLSLEEVAERLQVSGQTVRRWIKSGRLVAYKPGLGWRIRPSDLEAFLETRSSPKASSRSTLEPTLEGVLEEERREEPKAGASSTSGVELPGLKATRERRGWSRNELAAKSGVPTAVISGLESGARKADGETLARLARELDCYKGDLFMPAEIMEAFRARDAQENDRLKKEAESLTPDEVRALKLASPAFRKLSKAMRESHDKQAREEPEAG